MKPVLRRVIALALGASAARRQRPLRREPRCEGVVNKRSARTPRCAGLREAAAALLVLLGSPGGALAGPEPAATFGRPACAAADSLTFFCGITRPEDMVLLPGGRWIVVGGMGGWLETPSPGPLRLIDTRSRTWRVAHPVTRPQRPEYRNCEGPPAPEPMTIHGLALRRPAVGPAMLYAINHAKLERIEIFEVSPARRAPQLAWVGCVEAPGPLRFNSIAVAPDGEMIATVFTMPGQSFGEHVRNGLEAGGLYQWTPGAPGFVRLPVSLSGPNGIEISDDGRLLYVAEMGKKRIVAFSRKDLSEPVAASGALGFWPDNVHWDDRGRLVTAGMDHNLDACIDVPWPYPASRSTCERSYVVSAVDPRTLRQSFVTTGRGHPQFSDVSAALVVRGWVWIGAYKGERVAYRRAAASRRRTPRYIRPCHADQADRGSKWEGLPG